MKLSNGYTFIFDIPDFDVKNIMFGQRYGLFKGQTKVYWTHKEQNINLFNINEEEM